MLQKLAHFCWLGVRGQLKPSTFLMIISQKKKVSRFIEQKAKALLSISCLDNELTLFKLVHWGTSPRT